MQWVGSTRRFASKLCSWPKWTQRRSRPHNLSFLPLFGELYLGILTCLMSVRLSVCPAGGFGKHGQAPLLLADWLYRKRGFNQQRFHSRESKPGSSGSWLHCFKYQINTKEVRKEDWNKSVWCLLFTAQMFLSRPGNWRERDHLLAACFSLGF